MMKIIVLFAIMGFLHGSPAQRGSHRVPRDIRLIFTFPGTKWCGSGDTSNEYSDLGDAFREDQCCREHDYCSDVIYPHKTKHGLLNDSSYTRLSCDCDEAFYKCLRNIDSNTAYLIGMIYFNIYNAECFKKDFKTTGCLSKRWFYSKCDILEKDYSTPEIYQWFESPNF